jgi:NAD(P)-dependent dehydrogenase (short-subunit alcohol dehydrogenase family)
MSNPFTYEGKRIVVPGAATGVGAGLLDVLAELGAAHVTVLDVKAPTGPNQQFVATDLSDPAAVDAAVAAIEGPVDVLFNNAGVADTMPRDTVFKVNFLALRKLSEALLDRIPEGGAIVNTASTAGGQWPSRLEMINELLDIEDWEKALAWYDGRDLGVEPYFFSKELVQVYTMRSSRATMARGVRTNSVCPSPIDTPLLDDFKKTISEKVLDWTVAQGNGHLVTPREVATVLAFLGSEAAVFVNGVNLLVDAGFTAAMTTNQVDFAGLA